MGIVFALLSMLCFAVNIFITRAAMSRLDVNIGFPIVLSVNVAFACLVYALEAAGGGALPFSWKGAGWFALSGVIGIYLGRRMLLDAVHILGPARASVLHTASPAVTIVAAWFLVGERLGTYEFLLIGMVIAGLLASQLQPARSAFAQSEHRTGYRQAALLSLLTVVGFGIGNAVRGMAIRDWNEAALGAVFASAAALACQLATGAGFADLMRGLRKGSKTAVGLYAASGVATVSGTMFSAMAMHRVEIAVATVVTYTTPLVVFPVSAIVYKNREGLTLRTAAGAALVLAGIALLAFR